MVRSNAIAMSLAGAALAGGMIAAQVFVLRADEPGRPSQRASETILIDDIRRDRGSPLRGTILEPPLVPAVDAGRDFQRAMEKVASESPEVPSPLAPPPPRQDSPFAPTVPAEEPLHSLRRAARTLDGLAADSEDQADYSRADSLRKLARQLRMEARLLQPVPGDAISPEN